MTTVDIIRQNDEVREVDAVEMKPGEIGEIIYGTDDHCIGHIVMRTLSTSRTEIIDMTDFSEDTCWEFNRGELTNIVVRLYPDAQITIQV